MLFVLFATAGIYFELNYAFLGAVQLTVYAGGIIVLYVFSILLTSPDGDKLATKLPKSKFFAGLVAAVAGAVLCIFITLSHTFPVTHFTPGELGMKQIGFALLGTEKYQYMLPFEAISVLLLACIIGGIMIARKRG